MSNNDAQQTELGHPHRIVVVGGGAGGLELVTALGDRFGRQKRASVTLVDRSPTHLWKPLLHEAAAGVLDANAQALDYAAQARWHHFTFQQGSLKSLDRTQREITVDAVLDADGFELLPQRQIPYDTLVLAIGSVTNFFNTPGAAEHATALDTLEQAEHFRRRMIAACMRADLKSAQVHIVIIGGGATGVELSAELRNTAEVLAAYGMHHLNPRRDVRITVVEAAPRLLAALPERVSQKTEELLHKLDIDVLTDEKVSEIHANQVLTANGKTLP
ncbi:MAG TPA: FAD-dependent oxidoreductase, partial [Oxalicibacterium sp.]|nr:FAD-dependent oxidoreductase [Oxalicibacterium sp.]